MNREIKFRAWNKKDKKMYRVCEVRNNFDGSMRISIFNDIGLEESFLNGVLEQPIELMQFTGLKDKNGTDIYEGDIVKVNGEIYTNHEVRFEEDEAGFCPLLEFSYVKNEFEVIGTIYQDAHLLE